MTVILSKWRRVFTFHFLSIYSSLNQRALLIQFESPASRIVGSSDVHRRRLSESANKEYCAQMLKVAHKSSSRDAVYFYGKYKLHFTSSLVKWVSVGEGDKFNSWSTVELCQFEMEISSLRVFNVCKLSETVMHSTKKL